MKLTSKSVSVDIFPVYIVVGTCLSFFFCDLNFYMGTKFRDFLTTSKNVKTREIKYKYGSTLLTLASFVLRVTSKYRCP